MSLRRMDQYASEVKVGGEKPYKNKTGSFDLSPFVAAILSEAAKNRTVEQVRFSGQQ